MKTKLTALFLFVCSVLATAQAPGIEWQKALGSSGWDLGSSIQQTADGGYIVAGLATSNDGDVTGVHNSPYPDYWVVKLNNNGILQWQKSLGGSNNDLAWSITQTTDGGYIVAGYSNSLNGDVTGHHSSTTYSDYWVAKIDGVGNLQWQKSLGGTDIDDARSIIQASDGGYLVVGGSDSNNYDVTGNHGARDIWVVKLNSAGDIEWQKALGGSNFEVGVSVQETSGGYVIAGGTASDDGDVTSNHGGNDYWIVKIDTEGEILWQKTLGGSGEETAMSIEPTSDGGYIVAGGSNSSDDDVSGNHGDYDYWVIKLDELGIFEWQKSLGGSGRDSATGISQDWDGGYIVSGYSNSTDGDVTGNHGARDIWTVKLDNLGAIEWQKSLGGSGDYDIGYSVQPTEDNGYIIAGSSNSNDGDVTGNHGGDADLWVVKLWGDRACATWGLESSEVVTSVSGAITAETELLSPGSAPPYMYILGYDDNGQRLWQTGGWQGGPLDTERYVEFSASPNTGTIFTVTDVSFDYSDFLLGTDFHTLFFEVYYSTDGWQTFTLLGSGEYLGITVQNFHATINQEVGEGQTFSFRIFPYAPEHEGAIPSYATHSNVTICGQITHLMDAQEQQALPKISVYPNPVNGNLHFQSETIVEKIEILDLTGSKVLEKEPYTVQGEINMGKVPVGIYFAKIITGRTVKTIKIIKK